MEEEENKDKENTPSGPYTMGDFLARDKERAAAKLKLEPQYFSALQANPGLREYFKDYDPDSVTAFLQHYAKLKADWMTDDNTYAEWNERHALHWETEAMKRLEEIQQKKLFDIQCQWRAEQIKLPDTYITADFIYWSSVVLNCPFIDPITEDELNLYIAYMHSGNFDHEQEIFSGGWYDYEGIKEAYNTENENRNFPEWYDFYNGRTGAGVYMLLPDIRGQKEQRYKELIREEMRRVMNTTKETAADKRPSIIGYPDNQTPFIVSTFEDKQTQAFYKLYQEEHFSLEGDEEEDEDDYDEGDEFDFRIDMVMHDLERAPDIIPVKAHHDFREALKEAWEKYYIEKTAEALPRAYEQYMLRIQSGLSFHVEYLESKKSVREHHRNHFLRAREANGDPRNFDL